MHQADRFLVVKLNRQYTAHVEMWDGITAAAEEGAWPYPIDEMTGREERQVDWSTCTGLMGWFRITSHQDTPYPVVNFSNSDGPIPGCGNLLNEDVAVGKMAADFLLRAGYSRFFYLGFPRKIFSHERLEGFRTAVQAAGGEMDGICLPPWPAETPEYWNPQLYFNFIAEELVPHLAKLPPDAALFGVDYHLALYLEHALFTKFPERIHTTALLAGDVPNFQRWLPGERRSLSYVQTANREKGRAAMEWFIRHGRDKATVMSLQKRYPPGGIVEEASTAGPACAHPPTAQAIRWSWQRIRRGHPPTVEELASYLHLSSRTLNRQFNLFLGKSTRDFLLELRMESAAQSLLSQPDRLIEEVAADAGFTNQGAFAEAFRKWSGMTPRSFRNERSSGAI
jgi:LacI family transcriptional regulator